MKKLICQSVIFLIGFLISIETLSYIPSSDFILKEVIKNHGKGNYLIEQELIFSIEKTQKVVKETWYVNFTKADQKLQLYLLAKTENAHLERLYIDNIVYQKNDGKSLQRQKWPLEFIEPWFFTRSLKWLRGAILRHQMAGPSALNWNPTLLTSSQNKSKSSQPLSSISMPISLSRDQGRIMYTYQKEKGNSGLWIEQDKFVIRKLKLQTGVQILAWDYNDYVRSLKFPKHRLLISDNTSISIRVLKVTNLYPQDKKLQQKTSLQSFRKSQTNITQWGKSKASSILKDFYSRFR